MPVLPSLGSPAPARGLSRRRAVLGAAAALAMIAVALLIFRGPEPLVRSEAAFLRERAAVLQLQLELAKEEARYLLLDPDRGTLTFFHGPTPLRSWPLLSVQAGARRLGQEEEGWRSRRWSAARIEPRVERERRVLVSDSVEPPDLTGAVEWIPPTPEEEVPTPPRFVVHYEGGMGLEVLAVQTDSVAPRASLVQRAEHRLRRLLPRNWDRYRIQVTMPAAEAGNLYRSLPDSTSLLAIIPPH